jgi:arylsulfatase A-like enzyme
MNKLPNLTMNHLTIHKYRESNYLHAPNAEVIYVPIIYVLIKHLYNCRENSTNHPIFFKTNPISERPKMNISAVITNGYENETLNRRGKNKPNSNPIKPNFLTPKPHRFNCCLALDLCRAFSQNYLRNDRAEKNSSREIWRIFMNRRQFLKTGGTVMGSSILASCHLGTVDSGPAKKRPNILMITCHDLGRHLGCYGVRQVQSPNIDKLAAKGVRFANMFSTSSVCSPARGALHTGRYPQSNGLMGLTHAPWWWKFNKGEKHTAMLLRQAGYQTCLCGLQHVFGGSEAMRYGYQKVLSQQGDAEERTKAASKFLKERRANHKPFFLKVGFFEVHRRQGSFRHRKYDPDKPVFVPKYLAKTPAIREDLSRYQEDISYLDKCVGRILNALESNALLRNTIVVFTADHGIPYPGAKWGLRGTGIDVPLIIYQPGSYLSGGKVYKELISHVDVLPTLLDLVSVEKPANLQGISFADYLTGRTEDKPREEVYAQFTPAMFRDNESRCVRTKRYKLVRYFQAGRCVKYPIDVDPARFAQHTERAATTGGPRPYVQLFDVQNDPDQLNDIAGEKENAVIIKSLSKKLYDWMVSVGDPLLKGPSRTPYYQRSMEAFRETVL